MAKSRNDEIAERLHAAGARKRVARLLADAQRRVPGRSEPPKAAQKALADLRSLVSEVEDRVTGGSSRKRKEAAKKAATTRKRNAAKRSEAAKQGANTRKATTAKPRARSRARP